MIMKTTWSSVLRLKHHNFLAIIILTAVCCFVTSSIKENFDRASNSEIIENINKMSNQIMNEQAESVKQHNSSTTLFQRRDTTLESTVTLPFLKNYRNPCWRESCQDNRIACTRCLPYFFIAGAPKCGTTDFFRRLTEHPHISNESRKENHWLTRIRYSETDRNLSSYMKYFEEAVKDVILKLEGNNFHPMIFGDGSASTLWDNRNLLKHHKDKQMKLPPFTNADVIMKLIPNAKIIIMLRNPVTRLYSEYLYFKKSDWKGPEEFHKQVVSSLYCLNDCLRKYSLRYCTYFSTTVLRVHVGFYYIYIEDYFRAFPHEQIKIIKLEYYSQHINNTMNDVFSFLGIENQSDEDMKTIVQKKRANAKSKKNKILGDMLPKTRQLLTDFYKPWNERLVALLGKEYIYD